MAYGSEEGFAAHVGLEARDRQRHGRSGSLVLRHGAAMERGEAKISVEPGGGHSLTLEYDIE